MTKTVKLTENQILALYSAITIYEGSYSNTPKEDLKDWGVNKELQSLRQVLKKLDATAERVEA